MTRRKGRGLSSNPCSSLQDGLFGGLGCRVVRRVCRLLCRGGSLPGCLLELLHPLLGHLLEVLHSLPRGRLSSIHGLLKECQGGEEEISVRLHRLLGQRLESLLLFLILLSQLLHQRVSHSYLALQHFDAILKDALGELRIALLAAIALSTTAWSPSGATCCFLACSTNSCIRVRLLSAWLLSTSMLFSSTLWANARLRSWEATTVSAIALLVS